MTVTPRTLIAPAFKICSYTSQLEALQEACAWAGISHGRASQYQNLLREFFEENRRSKEHIFALNESFEVVDIWTGWKASVEEFPGLLSKIRDSLRKGPILREGEDPGAKSVSNKPRNDAFVYLLAGKLILAGKNVISVDGIGRASSGCVDNSDVVFEQNELELSVECKRPNSVAALEERTKAARRQIGERPGIIALDCSSVVRPPEQVIEKESALEAEKFLSALLSREVKPIIERHLKPNVLGFILFARAPAMTPTWHSRIVNLSGDPVESRYRPDCIGTWLLIENLNGSHVGVLRDIFGPNNAVNTDNP